MTTLGLHARPVVRETFTMYKGRPLVVSLAPLGVTIRRKGMKKESYFVPYDAVFEFGGKIAAQSARAEKAKARRRRK